MDPVWTGSLYGMRWHWIISSCSTMSPHQNTEKVLFADDTKLGDKATRDEAKCVQLLTWRLVWANVRLSTDVMNRNSAFYKRGKNDTV